MFYICGSAASFRDRSAFISDSFLLLLRYPFQSFKPVIMAEVGKLRILASFKARRHAGSYLFESYQALSRT